MSGTCSMFFTPPQKNPKKLKAARLHASITALGLYLTPAYFTESTQTPQSLALPRLPLAKLSPPLAPPPPSPPVTRLKSIPQNVCYL